MSNKLLKVGISHGDINGISYELILKTFDDARIFEFCIPVIYGSSKILGYHRKTMELSPVNLNVINNAQDAGTNRLNIINCVNDDTPVELSQATDAGAKAAELAMKKATEDLRSGHIDLLLSTPSNNEEIAMINKQVGGADTALLMLINDSLRIALATEKIPLAEVPLVLSQELLLAKIEVLQKTLERDFMITLPRIAVLSFNPGVGLKENRYGKEESEIIQPAIEAASKAGVYCFGPYSADDFFASGEYLKFDAVLAMYYDQGAVPFYSITADEGINYLANLPFIVSAPGQHVSYEKAGKNQSSPASFRQALFVSLDIYQNRIADKNIKANPLRKQYFERGSDNEKLDLTKDEDSE